LSCEFVFVSIGADGRPVRHGLTSPVSVNENDPVLLHKDSPMLQIKTGSQVRVLE